MVDTELRVYPRHMRACGYCLIPGARDWAKHHGIDWRDFIRNGVLASVLREVNDPMCQKVIAKAQQEQEQGNG